MELNEIKPHLINFENALNKVEDALKGFLESAPTEGTSAQEVVKHDLAAAYVLNSLFWAYVRTKGEDPRSNAVQSELDRIKACMSRSKELQQKLTKPTASQKVDKDAAKRFIKSALWNAAHKRPPQSTAPPPQSESNAFQLVLSKHEKKKRKKDRQHADTLA